jgi:hypothetical protein
MSVAIESASVCWQVECRVSSHAMKPYCIVILRNKKSFGESFVKASSSDFGRMQEYADQLDRDLSGLTNEQFVMKYDLRKAA